MTIIVVFCQRCHVGGLPRERRRCTRCKRLFCDDCLLRQDGALLCLLCDTGGDDETGAPPADTLVTQAEMFAPELFKVAQHNAPP